MSAVHRPYNFSAGPAAMPQEVLEKAASEMLNWQQSGMGVMEMSHRGASFQKIHTQAIDRFRRLLAIPLEFEILFMQGGGLGQNAIVPLNLSRGQEVDVLITGAWSRKSYQEALRYARAHVVADAQASQYSAIPEPSTWQLHSDAQYVHLCSNETIHGIEFHDLPDLKALGYQAPLVIDFSSHVASRPVEWSKIGLAFAGAQKNLGPAGLTVVVIRNDLLDQALSICPSAFHYQQVAQAQSMYNTPPTYAIYMAGLVFEWLEQQGGISVIEARNQAKAKCLYDYLDQSSLYENRVHPSCRSRMNVPFFLKDESLNAAFLSDATQQGLLQLKGHQSVGGMRASLYNAMPLKGVQALVEFMREFERTH